MCSKKKKFTERDERSAAPAGLLREFNRNQSSDRWTLKLLKEPENPFKKTQGYFSFSTAFHLSISDFFLIPQTHVLPFSSSIFFSLTLKKAWILILLLVSYSYHVKTRDVT